MGNDVPSRDKSHMLPVLPLGLSFPKTLSQVVLEADARIAADRLKGYRPVPTGFESLDVTMGGGLHPGDLVLVGGRQGIGKTIFALQTARNIALSGQTRSCYVCFEHDEEYLFNRLVCFESVESLPTDEVGLDLPTLHRYIATERSSRAIGLNAILAQDAAASRAMQNIARYWQRLSLSKGNPLRTTLKVLDLYVQELQRHGGDLVLLIDYLQKISLNRNREDVTDEEKVTIIAEGLKDLALSRNVSIVALAAADKDGLKHDRVRLADLRGGTALQYECDIAIIMNPAALHGEKPRKRTVLFSIEKNRSGPTDVELEFDLWGEFFRFDIKGRRSSPGPAQQGADKSIRS
ncbi:MAG: hypothetical protein EPO21_03980 [Chloroflexota bacterium]|nr:MAG: hypothetical protein EPO21_03980 [Chloroflexota bacterium]